LLRCADPGSAQRRAAVPAALWLLAACTPALDWRDVRPAGSGVVIQFPCRPSQQERRVALAGSSVRMVLSVCDAAGQTWALAFADVADPTRVAAALAELRAAAARNLDAAEGPRQALSVPGSTPQDGGLRVRLGGRRPDGRPVQEDIALFARGTMVFQASVVGNGGAGGAVGDFMASIRLEG
jgi:hypothetical protein